LTGIYKTEIDFILENSQVEHFREIIINRMLDAEYAMKHSLAKTTLADIMGDIGNFKN
jgi:hypothetical protein